MEYSSAEDEVGVAPDTCTIGDEEKVVWSWGHPVPVVRDSVDDGVEEPGLSTLSGLTLWNQIQRLIDPWALGLGLALRDSVGLVLVRLWLTAGRVSYTEVSFI